MARTKRVKSEGDAHYHLMSRTNGRRFLFEKGRCKEEMVRMLKAAAGFSGVRLEAWCMMDDHFHIVCKVVKPAAPLPEETVLERVAVLKGERFAARLADRWAELRRIGAGASVDAALDAWRRRMHDLSEFAKTFKEMVNVWYKARYPHCGGLWSGRFKSTMVEGREYLRTCIRYVELNPVRARMVSRAEDYAFSSRNGGRPLEDAPLAGPVPVAEGSVPADEARLLRRVAQIGGGVVFGSLDFVRKAVFRHGHCFAAAHVGPRAVMDGVYSSHGWRLAASVA